MKHLKSYKIFESVDIVNTLNDICLELNDDGFRGYGSNGSDVKPVRVQGNFEKNTGVSILMTKDGGFYFDDIKDIIYRITYILGDKLDTFKYKYCINSTEVNVPYWIKDDIDKLKDESMENINIKMYGLCLWASKK